MGETLAGLVERSGAQVISVVGLAKNTGKTTTLLYLIESLGVAAGRLALTSTGRDGEAVDEITRRDKPAVTVREQTLATTSERSLGRAAGLTVVRETPYMTATGAILVVRADTAARVVLEGPTTTAEMGRLVADLIGREGAGRVIIDGSLDRIAAAAPGISEGVILATGAILGPDRATAIRKTRHAADLFMVEPSQVCPPDTESARHWAVSADGAHWDVCEGSAVTDLGAIVGMLKKGGRWVFVSGAVTDEVLEALMEGRLFPTVIANDATRLFVSERVLARYREEGGAVRVRRPITLIALTVNPHNPEGVDFDPDGFLAEMRQAIPDVPVFDIVREESVGIQTRP
jgi:hypothetical protein